MMARRSYIAIPAPLPVGNGDGPGKVVVKVFGHTPKSCRVRLVPENAIRIPHSVPENTGERRGAVQVRFELQAAALIAVVLSPMAGSPSFA